MPDAPAESPESPPEEAPAPEGSGSSEQMPTPTLVPPAPAPAPGETGGGTPAPTTPPEPTPPPAMQPPAMQPPATQPPAMQPPVMQPPATQPPATQPPATQPPATQPPATQPPQVPLPPGVSSRFPAAGASGVCRDAALRLTFSNDVRLGSAGRISIFASNAPNTAVGSIDMAATTFTDTVAGLATNLVRPVFLDGRDAVAYFRRDALQPNTQYFVRVDAGVFLNAAGNSVATVNDNSWSFRTGAAPAASTNMVVDGDGDGGFCTLQSALDAVPTGNANPRTIIQLRNGIYHEIAYLTGKSNVTLRGEDREDTVISYPNNNNLNAGTARRAMLTALNANGFTIENLTLHNTTPQGGSQAEAIRVRGAQSILRNANFLSLQDTLLIEGGVYVGDSYIEGNVDFIWGQGAAFIERSEIKIVGRSGVIVQARNAAGASGYVFVDSRLTSDAGITNSQLARIDATVYPASQVVFINTQMGPHISGEAWTVTPAGAPTGGLRFWEFQSTDLQGRALNTGGRHPASRQISAAEAATLRNPVNVLGFDPTP